MEWIAAAIVFAGVAGFSKNAHLIIVKQVVKWVSL